MDIKELAQKAVEIKEKYGELERKKYGKEWSRTQIMEGFVGDVGDLMKLIMAKDGTRHMDNVDDEIAHELADCLFCVLVLSQRYDVDIEKSFLNTMDMLEKKISEEL